ncbi:oxygen-dependent tRNA uridine(34) hydroxylase TrhO [Rickettsia endosymbiont of Cardiosporidium cionae]|uniref:oxygen-dependent tRNA uridine(34) hydroxylase TrhO n=1 Tax=Rickettsia endosymbiont of Cardiosporidium cionae TaxID=2777155 RepID=UPI00189314E9|nr:rhodanese-like domain-containing protein [Rickettsia endosymbiont of Cardiosporidium cionae]KAF8818643.1 rhodanese domain-containing protein [Rickettsia endosymbiont of Cardiosporidium cionae]
MILQDSFNEEIAILNFYSFTKIQDKDYLLYKILFQAKKKYIRGTVIISDEGFNGTISGEEKAIKLLLSDIIKISNTDNINTKLSFSNLHPFDKIKVKIKSEIVKLNVGYIDVAKHAATYIHSENWDNFINSEDVILIDTRNHYETKLGHFRKAIHPNTDSFRDFVYWLKSNKSLLSGNKKIAMYCTGGIRCEKATAYMKTAGYTQLFQLKGGILEYLANQSIEHKNWRGECFVFDSRVSITATNKIN